MKTIARNNKTVGGRSKNTERLYNELDKFPQLTWKEQLKLIKHYKRTGCPKTREQILNSYMLFVVKVARQYMSLKNPILHADDLTSEGAIGLSRALENYDLSNGAKFTSHAVWWIRQAITNYISELSQPIRTPASSVYVNKAIKVLKAKDIDPTPESVAEWLRDNSKHNSIQESTVALFMRVLEKPVSMSAPIGRVEDLTFGDMVSDDYYTPHINEFSENILDAMETLSEREQYILKEYFGIGCRNRTLQEIADDLELVRERVRQIKNKALKKMQIRLKKTGV